MYHVVRLPARSRFNTEAFEEQIIIKQHTFNLTAFLTLTASASLSLSPMNICFLASSMRSGI